MDTTTIVIVLAGVVALSIVAIVISQMRERARIERARRMTTLEDSYKRANGLFHELPGQYLTKELKLLLVDRMESACKQLAALKSEKPIKEWLQELEQLKPKIQSDQDKRPPVKIDSPDKSRQIREQLKDLFKLIETMHKAGQVDGKIAKKQLKYVLFLVHKTHADLHIFRAREYIRQNELRKAIHEYHMASTEMGKSKDNPLAAKVIKSLRTRIKELESMATEGQAKQSTEEQHRLDKEWDSFLDDDSWKKRADYDD